MDIMGVSEIGEYLLLSKRKEFKSFLIVTVKLTEINIHK